MKIKYIFKCSYCGKDVEYFIRTKGKHICFDCKMKKIKKRAKKYKKLKKIR